MLVQPKVGQRWISDAESRLGLGTVIEADSRRMTLHFSASDETRTYAIESAPLTRVMFSVGDRIPHAAGWHLVIDNINEQDGVLYYSGRHEESGETTVIAETALHEQLQFASPRERLFTGLLDGPRWYQLRQNVLTHRSRMLASPVRGLIGARISLLPHQLQVAVEALRRVQPRLLLADEVGLGKTIEAGLIMHALRANNLVERVLILVPPPLLHQWLVEMRRRFNITPSIIDAERFAELAASAPEANPFLAEQIVLSTVESLLEDDAVAEAAQQAGWDLLIVDEAHHLEWQPDNPSPAWEVVSTLANPTPSVLLLTATPEQLGQAGHYARLHLLDPDRFPSLEAFQAEQQDYHAAGPLALKLHQSEALDDADLEHLEQWLSHPLSEPQRKTLASSPAMAATRLPEELLEELIDRHGTGRLLFRNTRHAVAGFPKRHFHLHSLEEDDDPDFARFEWLLEFMAASSPEKVLLICHHAETVKHLGEQLRMAGVSVALFHEGMSILERDRAAAWFADDDEPCRLLLCSEIGSEGRNFQFLHTLVCFELPERPDLLEQRIGRLDRIGQQHDIQIHVPVLPGSRDARLARFHHQALGAFENHISTGAAIHAEFGQRLSDLLAQDPLDESAFAEFIDQVHKRHLSMQEDFEQGRDRLLELHSNRPERIQAELDELARLERDFTLPDFMNRVFDEFGVDVEDQSDHWIIRPSDHMHLDHFPYLRDEGQRVCFSREFALAREEVDFLSWDHPMVQAALDLVISEGLGQADAMVISLPELPKGLTLLESCWMAECQAPARLSMQRWLHAGKATYHVGMDGRNHSGRFSLAEIDAAQVRFERRKLKQVILQSRKPLNLLIEASQKLAEAALPAQIESARAELLHWYDAEIGRLDALATINRSVRSDEIKLLKQRRAESLAALDAVQPQLASIRVLFNQ